MKYKGINKNLRKKILEKYNYKCFYCGQPLKTKDKKLSKGCNAYFYENWKFTKKNDTIDHVIPISKGGKDTEENLVACCNTCNQKKANK